jgi:hypothetical protein
MPRTGREHGRVSGVYNKIDRFLALIAEGHDVNQALYAVSAPRHAVTKWMKAYPAFTEQYDAARRLRAGGNGKPAAVTFDPTASELVVEGEAKAVTTAIKKIADIPIEVKASKPDHTRIMERIEREHKDYMAGAKDHYEQEVARAEREYQRAQTDAEEIKQARIDVLEWMDDLSAT